MNLDEIIQSNVRRFRLEAGLTQQQLADQADISVDAVRKWEGKRGTPDRESLTKIAPVVGRKMDDFNQENPPPPTARSLPPFALKAIPGAPDDLRREAELFIDQLNKRSAERDVGHIPGIRPARGQDDPAVTVRSGRLPRKRDRQGQQESTQERTSGQKRRRH